MDAELREYLDAFRAEMHERFGGVDQHFDAVDRRFESVDRRLDAVDRRFDAVDRRFDAVDQRFDAVDQRFDAVDGRVDTADGRITEAMHQFHVTVEGFRHQLQIVAEGIVMNAEALNRFRAEFIAEIHEIRHGR